MKNFGKLFAFIYWEDKRYNVTEVKIVDWGILLMHNDES